MHSTDKIRKPAGWKHFSNCNISGWNHVYYVFYLLLWSNVTFNNIIKIAQHKQTLLPEYSFILLYFVHTHTQSMAEI